MSIIDLFDRFGVTVQRLKAINTQLSLENVTLRRALAASEAEKAERLQRLRIVSRDSQSELAAQASALNAQKALDARELSDKQDELNAVHAEIDAASAEIAGKLGDMKLYEPVRLDGAFERSERAIDIGGGRIQVEHSTHFSGSHPVAITAPKLIKGDEAVLADGTVIPLAPAQPAEAQIQAAREVMKSLALSDVPSGVVWYGTEADLLGLQPPESPTDPTQPEGPATVGTASASTTNSCQDPLSAMSQEDWNRRAEGVEAFWKNKAIRETARATAIDRKSSDQEPSTATVSQTPKPASEPSLPESEPSMAPQSPSGLEASSQPSVNAQAAQQSEPPASPAEQKPAEPEQPAGPTTAQIIDLGNRLEPEGVVLSSPGEPPIPVILSASGTPAQPLV